MKKNKTSLIALVTIGAITLISQGCAANRTSNSSHDAQEVALIEDVQYTVKKGDQLGNISIAFTGEISHWKDIAAYNDISDPRTLRTDTVLLIPAALIPAKQSSATEPDLPEQNSLESRSTAAVSDSSNRDSNPATNALADVPGSITSENNLADVPGSITSENNLADVMIEPVSINRSFELIPFQESESTTVAKSEKEPEPSQIKVIGTYYPKGVYKQPASHSTLMFRAAPGTIFQLERQVNDWYQVVTIEGVGYLRASDGVVVDNN